MRSSTKSFRRPLSRRPSPNNARDTSPSPTFAATLLAAAMALTVPVPVFAEALPLATLTMGHGTGGIANDRLLRKVYVTNYESGTLSVVDEPTLKVIAEVPVGYNPRRLALDGVRHRAYIINDLPAGTLTVVDTTADKVVGVVPVGDNPRFLDVDFPRGRVYVVNRDSASITVVDAGTLAVLGTLHVAPVSNGTAVSSRSGRIFVASTDGTLEAFAPESFARVDSVRLGGTPISPTYEESTDKLFVNNSDGTVAILDATTFAVLARVSVGAGSSFGTVNALYRRYYLPNASSHSVSVIDIDSNEVKATIVVGQSPQQVIADSGDGSLLVVNRLSNSVSVIDARTETVVDTKLVGVNPWRAQGGFGRYFVLNENGGAKDSLTVLSRAGIQEANGIATEFLADGPRYFHTLNGNETRVLNDGGFGGAWSRTAQYLRVWTGPGEGRVPVCRFHGVFDGVGTHVFSPYANECDALKANPAWVDEGIAYYVKLPDAEGNCPPDTVTLHRYFNGQTTVNHRYTLANAASEEARSSGWTAEGWGPEAVLACVPPLVGSPASP